MIGVHKYLVVVRPWDGPGHALLARGARGEGRGRGLWFWLSRQQKIRSVNTLMKLDFEGQTNLVW